MRSKVFKRSHFFVKSDSSGVLHCKVSYFHQYAFLKGAERDGRKSGEWEYIGGNREDRAAPWIEKGVEQLQCMDPQIK